MRIVADTSGVVAAIVAAEPAHEGCRQALEDASEVFISPCVVTETCYLLRAGGHAGAVSGFLANLAEGFYTIVPLVAEDCGLMDSLLKSYADQLRRQRPKPGTIDVADAHNVVIAAQAETTLLLTLDQDYRAIRPLAGPPFFTLVPADLGP
ncbi:MAG: PIN domain-containing protein [Propionibacteriaceae bacterium]|jgi:predicted nucleic acid-binding protein|nr:PIN domain-containing protein [Propionibacteriaceae bacterium]